MKSYIVEFYTQGDDGNNVLIVKAAGNGKDSGEAMESAKSAVKSEYPAVTSSLYIARKHHMKLTPGKL